MAPVELQIPYDPTIESQKEATAKLLHSMEEERIC
jgi:hypothetical protein